MDKFENLTVPMLKVGVPDLVAEIEREAVAKYVKENGDKVSDLETKLSEAQTALSDSEAKVKEFEEAAEQSKVRSAIASQIQKRAADLKLESAVTDERVKVALPFLESVEDKERDAEIDRIIQSWAPQASAQEKNLGTRPDETAPVSESATTTEEGSKPKGYVAEDADLNSILG